MKNKRQKIKSLAFLPRLGQKKGVSAVVSTVILIALTVAAVSIVWLAVNNLVKGNVKSSEACFNVFDKVTLNPLYTCYNNTGGRELWFSINVGDIETVDDILVAISGEGGGVSFKILEDHPAELSYYPDRNGPVDIPRKNQGLTYIYKLPVFFTQEPDSIEIFLIIDGEVCGNIDSIEQFDSCSLLT